MLIQPTKIITSLQKKSDKCQQEEAFYICRVSVADFSCLGLICQLAVDLIDKNIFKHEQTLKGKSKRYITNLKTNKTQEAPVILIHEHNDVIQKYLESIILKTKPFLHFKNENHIYELWKITKTDEVEKKYLEIKNFLIADGHHRLNSFKASSDIKFFLALILSKKNFFTKTVYRKYRNLTADKKENCQNFLQENFGLEEIKDSPKLSKNKNFLLSCDGKQFLIKNSDTIAAKHKILGFLNKNINDNINQNINFSHEGIDEIKFAANDFDLIIPNLRLGKNLITKRLYPPHSTWFEPKIPDGLISLLLK